MKIKWICCILTALLLFSCSNPSNSNPEPENNTITTTVRGIVINETTNEPVPYPIMQGMVLEYGETVDDNTPINNTDSITEPVTGNVDGSFELTIEHEGVFSIYNMTPGYYVGIYNRTIFQTTDTVLIDQSIPLIQPDIKTTTITGTVTNAATGDPITSLEVIAEDSTILASESRDPDASGRFSITLGHANSIDMNVRNAQGQTLRVGSITYTGTESLDKPFDIKLYGDTITTENITFTNIQDGSGVNDVYFKIVDSINGQNIGAWTTGTESNEAQITFAHSNAYSVELYGSVLNGYRMEPAEIVNSSSEHETDIDLIPLWLTTTISGTVTDRDTGNAIEAATVTISYDGTSQTLSTDSQGHYQIEILHQDENMSLKISKDGYPDFKEEISTRLRNYVTGAKMGSYLSTTVSGNVSGLGQSLQNMTVKLKDATTEETVIVHTDENGAYNATITHDGTFIMYVYDEVNPSYGEGYATFAEEISAEAGNLSKDINLARRTKESSFYIGVRDGNTNAEIFGANVIVNCLYTGESASGITSGVYNRCSLEINHDYRVTLTVAASGYEMHTEELVLTNSDSRKDMIIHLTPY